MVTALALPAAHSGATLPAIPTPERVRLYLDASKADSTKRAYRSDWSDFRAWCEHAGAQALPATPETVSLYICHLADTGKKASTIGRRLAAIRFAHRAAGKDSPTASALVEATAAGVRRQIGTAQHGKAPVVKDHLRAMIASLPDTLIGKRDRALLLLGFAGAFRRSELVALDLADMQECPEGLRVTVRRSKTDQEGEGQVKGIPASVNADLCPVKAVKAWIAAAGIEDGALFRGVNRHGKPSSPRLCDRAVADVVKRTAAAAGLDPALFSGHSLRAGLATSAAAAGVSERAIMATTGHKSERMVRRYIRDGNLFRENAAAAVLV